MIEYSVAVVYGNVCFGNVCFMIGYSVAVVCGNVCFMIGYSVAVVCGNACFVVGHSVYWYSSGCGLWECLLHDRV